MLLHRCEMSEARPESFAGLNAIVGSGSRSWSIAKKCQAVEACLEANRHAAAPLGNQG